MGRIEDRLVAYESELEAQQVDIVDPNQAWKDLCRLVIQPPLWAAAASIKNSAVIPASQTQVMAVREATGHVRSVLLLTNNCLLRFNYVSEDEIDIVIHSGNPSWVPEGVSGLGGMIQTTDLDSTRMGVILNAFIDAAFPV
jgi:hypothetical protein